MRQLVVLVLLICIACSDNSSADDNPDARNGAADVDRFIEAYCQFVRNCCSNSGLPLEPLSDCETEVERQIDLLGVVKAGKALLLQSQFNECIAAIKAASDSCNFPFESNDACRSMWKGTVQEGGSCESVLECQRNAGPVVCLKIDDPNDPLAEEGVCRQLTKAALSDACALDIDDDRFYGSTYSTPAPGPALAYCDRTEGLYCSFPDSICEALPTEGERCEFDCSIGLYCDEGEETCMTELIEGEVCESHDQCASGLGCFGGVCGLPKIGDTEICEGDFN